MSYRNRRLIFIFCMAVSLLLHGVFLAIAPNVTLLRALRDHDPLADRIRVMLRDDVPVPRPTVLRESTPALVSRPGSVSDMLDQRDDSIMTPSDTSFDTVAQVPNMIERMTNNLPERQYDLERDPNILKRVNSRILEISEEEARRDIEVTRRLVRPSPERILEEDELPVLRSHLTEPDSLPFIYSDLPRSLLLEGVSEPSTGVMLLGERPDTDQIPQVATGHENGLAVEAFEKTITRQPLEEERAVAQAESPYEFWDDLLDIKLTTYLPPGDTEGYFQLQVLPRAESVIPVLPKHVIFVLDTSNSMTQIKVNAIIRGIRAIIPTLRDADLFNIVAFRDTPNFFRPESVFATSENKQLAMQFVDNLESRGSTDFYNALLPVVQQQDTTNHARLILVISDGRPTAGLRDARAIINGLTMDNNLRHGIFAVGGGNTVNRSLLDLLAYRNKGEAYVSESVPGLAQDLPLFFSRYNEPILTDIKANFGRLDDSRVFPRLLPDFFKRRPVTIYGRFNEDQDEEFLMRLSGAAGEVHKEVLFQKSFADAETGDASIASRWAFQKAYHLIGEMSRLGETPELRNELNTLSRVYNIRTSYDE